MPRPIHAVALLLLLPAGALSQGAQYTAAISDLNVLENAMTQFHIDTNWYTTIENLDDTPQFTAGFPWQWINNDGGTQVINVTTGDWNPTRRNLTTGVLQYQGPYVNFPRGTDGPASEYDPYTPIDPWGNPYYFYTPLGLARPIPQDLSSSEGYGDVFDRFAFVSHGADGVLSSDDVIRLFGSGVGNASPTVTRAEFSESTSRGGGVITVRGWKLGDTQGSGAVLINGSETGSATTWNTTRIEVPLGDTPVSGASITIRLPSGAVLGPVPLQGGGPPLSEPQWFLYGE